MNTRYLSSEPKKPAHVQVARYRLGFADRGGRGAGIFWLAALPWRRHAAQADNAQKRAPARIAVPVKIAPVEKADFPVYLTGLGTVQGFNTVVVRTRVDGQINRIAFQEGQFVKEGDTLVEIDPRPFQAALDQAKAKKAQDEANLANANLDLQRYTKLGEFATRQQTDTQRSTVAQLTAQIEADTARSKTPRPSSTTPPSRRRSPASPACARSMSAISSMPRPRPAS